MVRDGIQGPRGTQDQRSETGNQDSLRVASSEVARAGTGVTQPGPPAHPGTRGLHLQLLARDTAPGVWGRLTLDLGCHRHLTALQLQHTLVVARAVLGAEAMAVGAASGAGPGEPRGDPSSAPGWDLRPGAGPSSRSPGLVHSLPIAKEDTVTPESWTH